MSDDIDDFKNLLGMDAGEDEDDIALTVHARYYELGFEDATNKLHPLLSAALARNKELEKVLKKAEIALRPFAGRVYNDNGDLTINTGHFDGEELKATYFIRKKIKTALNEDPAPVGTMSEQGPGASEGDEG